jgi:hypothetical protein
LWDQTIEKSFEVATYRRIGVLVDGQRRRGMLQPQMQQTDPTRPEFRQAFDQLVRYQMKAPGPCPQGYQSLLPHTVLRTFGAHSSALWEKTKALIFLQ